MKAFVKKLVSSSDDVSSKRVIGLISFLFLLAAGIVDLSGGTTLSADFIAVFGSIIGATLLGNVIEKINKNNNDVKLRIESEFPSEEVPN